MAWDNGSADLIGVWEVAKARSVVGDRFDFFTAEEVAAELDRMRSSGELDSDPAEMMSGFSSRTEFTGDGKVLTWMKAPEGVPQEAIDEALASGEIKAFRDGFFCLEEKPWKEENGEFFYDTGEHREMFGEMQSSWDKLELNADGLLKFGSGMLLLRKM